MSTAEQIKKSQLVSDEIDLVKSVLNGYPQSMARDDALRALRVIGKSHANSSVMPCESEPGLLRQQSDEEVLKLKRRIAELERVPTLYASVEEAAGALPDGWEIRVRVERGAGTVELFDPDGVEIDFSTNNERLDITVKDALDTATEIHNEAQPASAQEK